jgi:hypothetical protein
VREAQDAHSDLQLPCVDTLPFGVLELGSHRYYTGDCRLWTIQHQRRSRQLRCKLPFGRLGVALGRRA